MTLSYIYTPQIYFNLGGRVKGLDGKSLNKFGVFSCVYIDTKSFSHFSFIAPKASIDAELIQPNVTPFETTILEDTDWASFNDGLVITVLPNFFIIYFGQKCLQREISNDNIKVNFAKLGEGYNTWVSTVVTSLRVLLGSFVF
jgi:hypothetical protein